MNSLIKSLIDLYRQSRKMRAERIDAQRAFLRAEKSRNIEACEAALERVKNAKGGSDTCASFKSRIEVLKIGIETREAWSEIKAELGIGVADSRNAGPAERKRERENNLKERINWALKRQKQVVLVERVETCFDPDKTNTVEICLNQPVLESEKKEVIDVVFGACEQQVRTFGLAGRQITALLTNERPMLPLTKDDRRKLKVSKTFVA